MEEKLYFKPVNYGKGKKKIKQSRPKDEGEKSNNRKTLKLICILLLLLIVVAVLIWLLHGKTTTHGQYPESTRNESLSCVSKDLVYEKVNQKIAENRELKINAVFYSSDRLSSLSLIYSQEFGSNSEAYDAENVSITNFRLALQKMGYSHTMFNNKFTRMDNKLIVTLHAEAGELEELTKEYFLIDRADESSTLNDFRNIYELQGLECKSTTDKEQ